MSRAHLHVAVPGVLAGVLALSSVLYAASWISWSPTVRTALFVLAWSLSLLEALSLLALGFAMARAATNPVLAPEPVSVLVAAWNERNVIENTVRGLLAQEGVTLEVVLADDGSTDGTAALVERAFAADRRVRVLRLPHRGKGWALEAARKQARFSRIATVDADTALEPGALSRLVAAVHDDVVAAGGAVLVSAPKGLLGRFQSLEYLRTTWTRAAWAELGMLEQIPGAFSVFEASALERAGGFPTDSLTEDYEVSFRLYDDASLRGQKMQIALVPDARAWTAPPDGLMGFVRQRTRWFAGFLSTLFRFRRLIGAPSAGRFGLLRLPIKLLDAVTPLLGAVGLCLLAVQGSHDVLVGHLSALGAVLILPLWMRALGDVAQLVAARALSPELSVGRGPMALLMSVVDAWSYGILRQLVVLRAYPYAAAKVTTWERSRTLGASDAAQIPAE